MNLQRKVFKVLKPEVQAFGFNRDELMSVAAHIANNLQLEDDASEEDTTEAIKAEVEKVKPLLKFGQSMATRVINDSKPKNDPNDDYDDDDDDGEVVKSQKKQSKASESKKSTEDKDAMPSWASDLVNSITALKSQVEQYGAEKISTSRKGKIQEVVKDSGVFGARVLKNFEKMTFANDEEFEDFLSEVEEDLSAYKQELADSGLSHLGNPPATKKKVVEKEESLTDEQIEELAESF